MKNWKFKSIHQRKVTFLDGIVANAPLDVLNKLIYSVTAQDIVHIAAFV
jgi:hypothetical protein